MGNQRNLGAGEYVLFGALNTSTQGKYELYFSIDCTESIRRANVVSVAQPKGTKLFPAIPSAFSRNLGYFLAYFGILV